MEVIASTVLGVCMCATLSIVLINCVRCRKKLTEEEIQQRYFEKFRKKHMSTRDRVLTNRVDVIRPRSDSQVSSMSFEKDPTYQTIQTLDGAESHKSDKDTVDDHSFFDESFQTVVEASSYNTTGLTDTKCDSNLLSASTNLASYISFQQQNQLNLSSQPILQPPYSGTSSRQSGRINRAFSGDSSLSDRDRYSHTSESDDYVSPNQGPRIIVTKPSIKIHSGKSKVNSEQSSQTSPPCKDCSSPEFTALGRNSAQCQDVRLQIKDNEDCESPKLRTANIEELHKGKLRMEGKSFNENMKRYADQRLKGRKRLVIPRALPCDMSQTDSVDDEHTYESLTSVIADTNMRHDSCDVAEETGYSGHRKSTDSDHTYDSIMSKSCESLITSISKPLNHVDNELPVINVEEVRERQTRPACTDGRSSSDSDTAVVIIGRKVSWRYKPIMPSSDKKSNSKTPNFSKDLQTMLSQNYKSPAKSRRDSLDRYSPFPSSTKKLAFKSPFKQVASPRFPSMQIKSGGHLKPTFLTELLNSASKSIGIENFNIDTPEIKVKDSPKVFTVDSTVFLSPLDCLNKPQNTPNLDTDFSPLAYGPPPIKDLKTKFEGPFRESLPSLPDNLELVIENHCNRGLNTMSTPTI